MIFALQLMFFNMKSEESSFLSDHILNDDFPILSNALQRLSLSLNTHTLSRTHSHTHVHTLSLIHKHTYIAS